MLLYQVCTESKTKETFVFRLLIIDNQTKPLLSYSELQSGSILLSWRVSNGRYDRFNHFIIYYRRLQNSYDNSKEANEFLNPDDYKQVLVDPRTTYYSFTFRVNKSLTMKRCSSNE